MPRIEVSIEDELGVDAEQVDAADYGDALMTDEVSDLIARKLSGRDEGRITMRIGQV